MDLRSYYKKIHDTEAELTGEYMVVVSLPTSEGGKEGVRTEVLRSGAAKLIVEGRARLATDAEAIEFYEASREARQTFDDEEAARRVQVMVIPSHDLKKPKERS